MYVSYVKLNQICKEEFWILCRKMQYLTFLSCFLHKYSKYSRHQFTINAVIVIKLGFFNDVNFANWCDVCLLTICKINLNSDHLRFLVVDFEFAYSGFKQEEDFRNAIPVGGGVSSFEICLRSGF